VEPFIDRCSALTKVLAWVRASLVKLGAGASVAGHFRRAMIRSIRFCEKPEAERISKSQAIGLEAERRDGHCPIGSAAEPTGV
jgi:hypothetical protein